MFLFQDLHDWYIGQVDSGCYIKKTFTWLLYDEVKNIEKLAGGKNEDWNMFASTTFKPPYHFAVG